MNTMNRGVSMAAVATVIAASTLVSACSADPDDVAYCVDKQGKIVDQKYCDNNGQYSAHGSTYPYWIWWGRYQQGLQPGTTLDSSLRSGSANASDQAARARAGLPSTGKIVGGKSISGKSGGFGLGGGEGHEGGFGG